MDRYNDDGSANVIPGHSLTFAVLGTLILAFGWYGFNVGTAATVFEVTDSGELALASFTTVGRVALTTTLAMACGAIGAGLVAWLKTGKVDTLYVANGLLAGLVGITAIPDTTAWWGAFVVGGIAGAQLPIVFEFVEEYLKIDDVCAVFPVHGSAGIIGTLLFPFVAAPGVVDSVGTAFAAQVAGVAVITVWTVAATALVFGAFKAVGQARVSEEHERDGLDVSEHGVDTYPEFGQPDVATDGGHTEEIIRSDGGEPNDGRIKMVTAIVRPDRLGAIKQSLAEAGAPSLTVTNVSGRGSQPRRRANGAARSTRSISIRRSKSNASSPTFPPRRSSMPSVRVPKPANPATARSSSCPSRARRRSAPARPDPTPSEFGTRPAVRSP